MGTGAITQYVDVAQLVLYLFWLFFAGIVYYLVRENHREGYPMEVEGQRGMVVTGWPVPAPKTYKRAHGPDVHKPDFLPEPPNAHAQPAHGYIGAPIVPTGDPMKAGVGPGSFAQRADHPELGHDGKPFMQPLRLLPKHGVSHRDTDPRGLPVVGADGEVGGTVTDIWLDVGEQIFRYLEIEAGTAAAPHRVLLPIPFARIGRHQVSVSAVKGHHFKGAPTLRNYDQVTLLEEEMSAAYFGGGTLYADPDRAEPLF